MKFALRILVGVSGGVGVGSSIAINRASKFSKKYRFMTYLK
jgi:hypothetical protein